MLKILFLAANPTDAEPLRLAEEIREIRAQIASAEYRDFIIEQEWAPRPKDLINILEYHKPHVVHFLGHGTATGEILLMDDQGDGAPVTGNMLADIFRSFKKDVKCVVLNACYTAQSSDSICETIDFVIGMKDAVGDDAAREFSVKFYSALANGKSVLEAVERGQIAMELAETGQGKLAVFRTRIATLADECLTYRPELVCQFYTKGGGGPVVSEDDDEAYVVRAFISNAPTSAYSVVYQLDKKYHRNETFNEVRPDERDFELYFDCPHDFEIRATLWQKTALGIGFRTHVCDALEKYYGATPRASISKTIRAIRERTI